MHVEKPRVTKEKTLGMWMVHPYPNNGLFFTHQAALEHATKVSLTLEKENVMPNKTVTTQKIEDLEFRIDLMKELINALLLKDKGVVLLWAGEYDELMKEAGHAQS